MKTPGRKNEHTNNEILLTRFLFICIIFFVSVLDFYIDLNRQTFYRPPNLLGIFDD